MDLVALTGGLLALCGAAAAWLTRRRAERAEAEVTQLRRELAAERHAAAHDPLTGLPNRRAFYQLGAALVADPARQPMVAVLLDLDDFKQINDRLGHAAGDQVLITVARRLAAYAGDSLVARLGGDEFAGVLTLRPWVGVGTDLDDAWLSCAARELADALAAPMLAAGHPVALTASVGLVPVRSGVDLAEVLRRADAAMYRAKSGGYGVSTRPLRHHHIACHGTHPAETPPIRLRGPAETSPIRLRVLAETSPTRLRVPPDNSPTRLRVPPSWLGRHLAAAWQRAEAAGGAGPAPVSADRTRAGEAGGQ